LVIAERFQLGDEGNMKRSCIDPKKRIREIDLVACSVKFAQRFPSRLTKFWESPGAAELDVLAALAETSALRLCLP